MLTVGDHFPPYRLKAVVSTEGGREFQEIDETSYAGKWRVVFFWPMDFTFVCPTELAAFNDRLKDFAKRDAQVLGVSTDTQYVHLAWRKSHRDLKHLGYPMMADYRRELSSALGILHPTEAVCVRATFVVDPDGLIRFVSANDLATGRSVDEVLRVLEALQTGGMCPANWHSGKPTLEAA